MAEDTAHAKQQLSGHTGEQEPSGPGHPTSKANDGAGAPVNRGQVAQDTARNTTHRVGTPVNRSQVAQHTARQHRTERAHR